MAWRIAEQVPGVERLMPKHGKDWNERLMHSESSENSPPYAHNAEMNQLWQWHLTAKRLGKSDAYLRRITEVARDTVKGSELSNKASVAMAQDMACLAQMMNKARGTLRNLKTMAEVER
ncbi:MAG: hypothetical protein F6J95_020140 [Leptolyngbya sp. SIO1E4]|nr:hypothetical protein [Leptolyngbya sp. SIO1E4]